MERVVRLAGGTTSRYAALSREAFYMEREAVEAGREVIDAFCHFWVLLHGDSTPGQVTVRGHAEDIVGTGGPTAIFCPPFSLIHWKLSPGTFRFSLVACSRPLPSGMPVEPVLFDCPDAPKTVEAALTAVQSAKLRPVGKLEISSAVARRAKEWIAENYRNGKSLAEGAQELHLLHSEMSRGFRKCYGLSPIAYRNRLRVMHAFWEVLMGTSKLKEISTIAGFNDLSRFNKQFARMMYAAPSFFRNPTEASTP